MKHCCGIDIFKCNFDSLYYQDELFTTFNIIESSVLIKAVNKRKAEFLAGRYAAKKALEKNNVGSFQVEIGENRCPIWPAGITGSITHSSKSAVSAVARTSDYSNIGIDMEKILDGKTSNELKNLIVGSEEAALFSKLPIDMRLCLTIAFSAKESIFKALYPSVHKYFQFEAANITDFCVTSGEVGFILTEDLSFPFVRGFKGKCYYSLSDSYVFTYMLVKS